MNILMHCVYFPPEVGGLESHVYYLCRSLVKSGHSVSVVTSRSLPEAPAHEVMEGIEVFRTWFPARNPAGWIAHALGSIPRTRRLAYRADVVHAQAFQSIPPCAWSMRGRDAAFVATLHTSHFLQRAEKPAWQGILRRTVRAPHYLFAASTQIADVAVGLAPQIRMEALTNGVETDLFRPVKPAIPGGARRRLIVPRRLFEKNGVEFFVRAMPLIAEQVDVEGHPRRRRPRARTVGGAGRGTGGRGPNSLPGRPAELGDGFAPELGRTGGIPLLDGGHLGGGARESLLRDSGRRVPSGWLAGDHRRPGGWALRAGRSGELGEDGGEVAR